MPPLSSWIYRLTTTLALAAAFDVRSTTTTTNCPFNPDRYVLPTTFPQMSPELQSNLTALEHLMKATVANNSHLPSMVAALNYNGQTVWNYGAGETKRGNQKTPDLHTKYRVGSVSKVFPVLQLYMLAEHPTSAITLDNTLSNLPPNHVTFVNPSTPQNQPTLRQLASQRAGLPRAAPCNGLNVLFCNVSNAEMIQHINATTLLISQPGGVPSYSNLAFALLGNELATIEGTTFEEWVQTNILKPLSLNRTGFGLDTSSATNAATGYRSNGMAVGTYHLGWNMPCGGMSSSVHDLNVLSQAIMAGTLFHNQGTSDQLMNPLYLNPGGKTLFGTPWEMAYHSETGYLVRRKGGNVPGYTALMAFVPELKLSLSILWSGHADEFGGSEQAFDRILTPINEMFQEMATKEEPLQPTDQASFVGTYSSPNITGAGGSAVVSIHANKLVLKVAVLNAGMYLRQSGGKSEAGGTTLRTMQMWVPRTLLSCLALELQAFLNQYVVFNEGLTTFSIPGLVPGFIWTKDG